MSGLIHYIVGHEVLDDILPEPVSSRGDICNTYRVSSCIINVFNTLISLPTITHRTRTLRRATAHSAGNSFPGSQIYQRPVPIVSLKQSFCDWHHRVFTHMGIVIIKTGWHCLEGRANVSKTPACHKLPIASSTPTTGHRSHYLAC